MKNKLWTKGVIISIILLLVAASVVPIITGTIRNEKNESLQQKMNELPMRYTSGASLFTKNIASTTDPSFHPDERYTTLLNPDEYHPSRWWIRPRYHSH